MTAMVVPQILAAAATYPRQACGEASGSAPMLMGRRPGTGGSPSPSASSSARREEAAAGRLLMGGLRGRIVCVRESE